jgi:hypothetical protein
LVDQALVLGAEAALLLLEGGQFALAGESLGHQRGPTAGRRLLDDAIAYRLRPLDIVLLHTGAARTEEIEKLLAAPKYGIEIRLPGP